MNLPPGFHSTHGNQVCRLQKSLYGLRQARGCLFPKLSAALKECGFRHSYADYSLFTCTSHIIFMCVLIYVDDLIITGNNPSAIAQFKLYLSIYFHMKDLGSLKYFLGIEIA